MAFQKYDNNWVYDYSRGIYIARSPLIDSERTRNAAKKAGLDLRLMSDNSIVSPTDDNELDRLMKNLDNECLGEKFRNKKSRILTLDEYDEMMNWAEKNDSQLYKSSFRFFEVLDFGKFGYVVNSYGAPAERENLIELKNYLYSPENLNIGVKVREVLE